MLGHLDVDPEHRVQRGGRVLDTSATCLPRTSRSWRRFSPSSSRPSKRTLPDVRAPMGSKPSSDSAVRVFPAPLSPGDPQDLALLRSRTRCRRRRAGCRREVRSATVRLSTSSTGRLPRDVGTHLRIIRAVRGSSMSRSASPRKLNASTTVKMASPGNRPIHQLLKFWTPSETIEPHSAVGGCAPETEEREPGQQEHRVTDVQSGEDEYRPGNVGTQLDPHRAPAGRAEQPRRSDVLRGAGAEHEPADSRAYDGQETTITANTALRSSGPSAAATAMARMIPGNANTRSAIRMMTESTKPAKKPAMAPRVEPIIIATATRSAAKGSERRAPYRTRLNTSRPSSSVPNKYTCDGAALRGANCRFGGYGASSGAKMAIRIQATMMVMPMIARGWRQGGRSAARSLRVRRSPPGPA